jgi:hypothetical protein
MAITEVTQLPDQATGGWDELWRRTYTRTFQVECSSQGDNEITIRSAVDVNGVPLIPPVGTAFNEFHLTSWVTGAAISVKGAKPLDLGAFVQKHAYSRSHARQNTSSANWTVTVEWGPYDASLFPSDPTLWPITIEFGGNRFEQVIWADVTTGNPIVNSAGRRFEEPCLADNSRVTFTVTRNELIDPFGLTLASTFNDTLNSLTWNGFPPKTAKMGIITADGPYWDSNNQVWYYKVKYPIEVTRTDWKHHPIDQGFSSIVSGNLVRAKTFDGQDSAEPVPLNGSGAILTSGPPVILSFDKYLAVDWTPLAIDLTKRLGT